MGRVSVNHFGGRESDGDGGVTVTRNWGWVGLGGRVGAYRRIYYV